MNSKTRRNRELKSILFICQIHIYISGGRIHPSSTWYRRGRQRSTRLLELQGEKRKLTILNGFVHSEVRRRAVCRLCFPTSPPTPTHQKCVRKGGSADVCVCVGGGWPSPKCLTNPSLSSYGPRFHPESTLRQRGRRLLLLKQTIALQVNPDLMIPVLCDVAEWCLTFGWMSIGWMSGRWGWGGDISQEDFAPFLTLCHLWVFLFFVCFSWGWGDEIPAFQHKKPQLAKTQGWREESLDL